MNKNLVLGVDIGTNSLGWCLLRETSTLTPLSIVALGSRIFPMALEDKNKVPLNHARRRARLIRRGYERKKRKKARLRSFLRSQGFLDDMPSEKGEEAAYLNRVLGTMTLEVIENGKKVEKQVKPTVYDLRKKALDEPLSPPQLAYIWLHFASRRGFQSNRKTRLGNLAEHPEAKEILDQREWHSEVDKTGLDNEAVTEEKKALAGIADLEQTIKETGSRTLGEYLASLPKHQRKRKLRTSRAMYSHEFDEVWKAQAKHHPKLMNDEVGRAIWEILFYQRPLKLKPGRRGHCPFETGRPRAHKAWPVCQEFRIWQNLHNLRMLDKEKGEFVPLCFQQKQILAEIATTQAELSYAGIKKALGLNRSTQFNLEDSKKKLEGNRTTAKLRKLLPQWPEWDPTTQEALVTDLLTIEDKKALFERLRSHWNLPSPTCMALCETTLEPGMLNLSLKAVKKLLPLMKSNLGLREAEDQLGYHRDKGAERDQDQDPFLGPPPFIANPVVNRAMNQLRVLFNAVAFKYGKPQIVRVELARDVKLSKKKREQIEARQKANKKLNEKAATFYAELREASPHLNLAETMSKQNKLKYRLWVEQNHMCPYNRETITCHQLFSSAVEVDHILPYQRSADDSYMNKVVCMASANQEKGNKTPHEWLGQDSQRFESIKQSVAKNFPRAKQQRFFAKDMEAFDGFVNRQLTDTAYIAREVQTYLGQKCRRVSVTRGSVTALLRKKWGLNLLLGDTGEKNRNDHRHHAVDAAVIALTHPGVYREMAACVAKMVDQGNQGQVDRVQLKRPLTDLRQMIDEKLNTIIISHAPTRGLTGAFHEDTNYALHTPEPGTSQLALRVPVDKTFKMAQANRVIDPELRDQLVARLTSGPPISEEQPFIFRAKKGRQTVRHARVVIANKFNPEGHYIRSVQGHRTGVYKLGKIHHITAFHHSKKGRLKTQVHYTKDVAEKIRDKEWSEEHKGRPLIETDIGTQWEFVMALCKNDMVSVIEQGQRKVYRVTSFESPAGVVLRLHSSNSTKRDETQLRKNLATLIKGFGLKRLNVTPLGDIHP